MQPSNAVKIAKSDVFGRYKSFARNMLTNWGCIGLVKRCAVPRFQSMLPFLHQTVLALAETAAA